MPSRMVRDIGCNVISDDIDAMRELFEQAVDASADERNAILERLDRSNPAAADELRRMLEEDRKTSVDQGPSVGLPPGSSGSRQAASDGSRSADATVPHGHADPAGAENRRRTHSGDHDENDSPRFAMIAPESSRIHLELPPDSPTVAGVRLEGLLGVGGLGRVYRGVQGRRVVAVKVPRPDRLDESFIFRWREECALAHELPSHPNIVTVHQITTARFDDGTVVPAMVMEYLPGAIDLLDYARRHRLDRSERIALFIQACRGVSHLHSRAVVHGDIKPSNLLVIDTDDGPTLKVGDLGGTRTILRHDTRPPQFTWTYASPEQIADDPVKIGPQSDVFSLGKVLCAMLFGVDVVRLPAITDRRAYAGWTPPDLADRLGLDDGALAAALRRATARLPIDRFEAAGDFSAALQKCRTPAVQRLLLSAGDWLNPPPSPPRTRKVFLRRGAVALVAMALSMLLAVLLCNSIVRRQIPLQMVIGTTAPERFDHVAIVRLRDLDELTEVAERFGIDGIDPARVRTIRRLWAAVIRRLADAGAGVIAADIAFPQAPEPELDAVILDAVAAARRAGSAVVVAVQRPERELGPHRIAPRLRDEVDLIGDMRALPVVPGLGSMIMVVDGVDTAPRLPLAMAAAAATQTAFGLRDRLQIQVDAPKSRVVVRGVVPPGLVIPIVRFVEYDPLSPDLSDVLFPEGVDPGERVGFFAFEVPPDSAFEPIDLRVADVLDPELSDALRRRVAGRVVFIANNALPQSPDLHTYVPAMELPDGKPRTVPGPWFHAAATETILAGLPGPRLSMVGLGAAAVVTLVAILSSWWSGTVLGRPKMRSRSARRITTVKAVGTLLWLIACVLVPVTLLAIGTALELTIHYLVAIAIAGATFGLLVGIGLALRAAWGRSAQVANLREVTHAW